MKELAADGIPVAVTCRVLELAPPAVLPLAGHPCDRRDLVEAYRVNALFNAHNDDPRRTDGRADCLADLLAESIVERVR